MANQVNKTTHRRWHSLAQELRWLLPGMGVKRWLLVILAGITLLGIGLAVLTLEIYRTAPNTWWLPVLSTLSLRFLDRPIRVIIFGLLGVVFLLGGIAGLNQALLRPYLRPGKKVIETIADYRRRDRGPRIVAIGGGMGWPTCCGG